MTDKIFHASLHYSYTFLDKYIANTQTPATRKSENGNSKMKTPTCSLQVKNIYNFVDIKILTNHVSVEDVRQPAAWLSWVAFKALIFTKLKIYVHSFVNMPNLL